MVYRNMHTSVLGAPRRTACSVRLASMDSSYTLGITFLVLAFSLLRLTMGQLIAVQTYPIDWTDVPLSLPTGRNLTASCNCALLNIGCNLGCCCDPSCPSSLTSFYESKGTCLPSGAEQQTLKFCVPDSFVSKVNLPTSGDFYSLPVEQADSSNFFSQLLCIASDRNPNLGNSYPDPAAGPVGDNVRLGQCPAAAAADPANTSQYQFREHVYLKVPGATPAQQPLTLPYPVLSAACSTQYVVGFMVPTPAENKEYYASCQRDLSSLNLSAACSGSGALTPTYYRDMQVLPFPQKNSIAVPFNVVGVQYLDPSTGSLTSLDPNTTAASFDATSRVCLNVVAYVNMTFYYGFTADLNSSGGAVINKAELSLVLTDISSSSGPLQQRVRVAWIDTLQQQEAQFVASGNPGYITGFPVLAGSLVSDSSSRTAIRRLVSGLPLGAPGEGGACSPTALTAVKFGTNTSSSCAVTLTVAKLEEFCTTYMKQPDKYLAEVIAPVYDSILNGTLYVGEWGNAAINNTNDWIEVVVSGAPFSETAYSSSDKGCDGVVTGFDLQIVTGVAFSSNNLQQKVLYASLCFKTGTWDFPDYASSTTEQRFFLSFDVSFIKLPQQAVSVKKPAPPLVVPLPTDIFYPFAVSDSSTAACRLDILLTLLPALVSMLIMRHFSH